MCQIHHEASHIIDMKYGSQNSDMSIHDPGKMHNVSTWRLELTVKASSTVLSSAKVTVLYPRAVLTHDSYSRTRESTVISIKELRRVR
jgi:hypothetical protein